MDTCTTLASFNALRWALTEPSRWKLNSHSIVTKSVPTSSRLVTRWVERSCQLQALWAEVALPSQPQKAQQQNQAQLHRLLQAIIRQLLASRHSEARASQSVEPLSAVAAHQHPATIAMELLHHADARIRPQGLRQLKQQRLAPVLVLHW